MTLQDAKPAVDAAAIGIAGAAWLSWLPHIAALLTIIWFALRIWESETVKGWTNDSGVILESIANADETEITPEMIEAGVDAFFSSGPEYFVPDEMRRAIADAYRAMYSRRPSPDATDRECADKPKGIGE